MTARDRLLREVMRYAEAYGLTDVSLRTLAAALGTSHRMLIYHFGSREGLLAAVVAAVEADQREVMVSIARESGADPALAMRRFWDDLADPGRHEAERLFFDAVALALRGRPGTEGLREGLVEPWLDAARTAARALGLAPDAARLEARVGMALVRGLLLDLLATGDREGVDAAIEYFIARWSPAESPSRPERPPSVR